MTRSSAKEARVILNEVDKLEAIIDAARFKSLSSFNINANIKNGIGYSDTVNSYLIEDERLLEGILCCLRERKNYLLKKLNELE